MSDFISLHPMMFGSRCSARSRVIAHPAPTTCPVVASAEPTADSDDASMAVVQGFAPAVRERMNPDAIPQFVAADMVNHAAIPEAQGAAGMQSIARKLLVAFPDLKMSVIGMAAEDDTVIARIMVEGTHTGQLAFAKMPLEPTNKPLRIEQVFTFRVADGKIVESWLVMDRLDFMTQLGVGPAAGAPSGR